MPQLALLKIENAGEFVPAREVYPVVDALVTAALMGSTDLQFIGDLLAVACCGLPTGLEYLFEPVFLVHQGVATAPGHGLRCAGQ